MGFPPMVSGAALLLVLLPALHAQTPRPAAPAVPTAPRPGGPAQLPPRDGQAPAVGTSTVRGRVVRADNGQPLRRVSIRANAPGVQEVLTATTDDSGRYELARVPAGRYSVTAAKGGFVTLQYGQRRAFEPGRPIEVGDGQVLEQVDFAMPRGGAITGRIIDEAGEPVTGAIVQVLRQRYVKGQRQLAAAGGSQDRTDDLGEFRVFGIPPGTYYVSASQPSGVVPEMMIAAGVGSAATLYPGTLSPAEAQTVTIGLGQEVTGLFFALVPTRAATISGVVRTADGRVPTNASVTLAQSMAFTGGMSSRGGRIRPDGSFSFADLPPGRYTLSARGQPPSVDIATTTVVLEGADRAVTLTMRTGDTARGRFRFDTGSSPAALRSADVRVSAASLDGEVFFTAGPAVVRDDWTFEVPGLSGSRRLRVIVPSGWAVKSIRAANADVTDTPLAFDGSDIEDIEILLTQRITDVSGRVTDARGQQVAEATVVMFAEDRDKWGPESRFVSIGRPDQSGRFRLRALPPGRYLAVALEYLEPGEETNPDTLESLRRIGTSLTLDEGESRTLDLRLSEMP